MPDLAWALQERDSKGSESSTKDGHLIPAQIAIPIQEIGKRHSETQDDLAYALTNPGSGGRTHSRSIIANGVRRLTPVECERLQGFHDNWTAGFSDSTRYRMLGNAVAVPVAQWLAGQINRTC